MAKKSLPRPSKLSVYLYIPNIIGGYLIMLLDILFCSLMHTYIRIVEAMLF